MKRRDFIGLMGQSALVTAMTAGCSSTQPALDSRHLVDTPEKRERYLKSMLEALCADLEPRPTGSPACERGALLIKAEMERALPIVELDTFTFDRWVIIGDHSLFVGDMQLEAYPMIETAGTPPDGITGVLKKIEEGGLGYGLYDKTSGEIIGYVNTAFRNPAVPLYTYNEENRRLPSFTIDKDDGPLLEKAVREETPVRLTVQTEFIPDSETSNVVGTLPGETKDEILFLAHHDTVYSTPGANDNTASLIGVLMLAHALSGVKPKKTITFVATTGEENGLLGARHYAKKRKREGTFENLAFVFNVDSITWGKNQHIWFEDEELKGIIREIDRDLDIEGTPQFTDGDGFQDDSIPFRESGARGVYCNSTGYDNNDDLWHRPEDTPEMVPYISVEIFFSMYNELIRRIQDLSG